MRNGVALFASFWNAKRRDLDALADRLGWTRETTLLDESEWCCLRYRTGGGATIDAEHYDATVVYSGPEGPPSDWSPQLRMIIIRGSDAASVANAIRSAIPTESVDSLIDKIVSTVPPQQPDWSLLKYLGWLVTEPNEPRLVAYLRGLLAAGNNDSRVIDAACEAGCTDLLPELGTIAASASPAAELAQLATLELRERRGLRPLRRFNPLHTSVDGDGRGLAWIMSERGEVIARDRGTERRRVLATAQWSPMSLALAGEFVWFTTCEDRENSKLCRVPFNGGKVEVVVGGLRWPGRLAAAGSGVVVANEGNAPTFSSKTASLLRVRGDGRVETIEMRSGVPRRLACHRGTIAWVTWGGRLFVLEPGRSTPTDRGEVLPGPLAFDRNGGLRVARRSQPHDYADVFVIDGKEERLLIEKVDISNGDSFVFASDHMAWCSLEFGSYNSYREVFLQPFNPSEDQIFTEVRSPSDATELTQSLVVIDDDLYFHTSGHWSPDLVEWG